MVNFETWYTSIPVITRTYLTLSTLTSFAVTFDLLSPLQLYLNYTTIFKQYQIWRLLTTFLYFDKLSINFILHSYFLYFYCRRLEEHSFHRKSADFLYLILFGVVCMLFIAPMLSLPFMSHALVVMLLYVWSRKNPHERLRLYGVFTVGAGYLSYVLLVLTLMMGMSPVVDLVGILVGHIYFFLKHVIVGEYGERFDVLRTPSFMKRLFSGDADIRDEEVFEELFDDDVADQQQMQQEQQEEDNLAQYENDDQTEEEPQSNSDDRSEITSEQDTQQAHGGDAEIEDMPLTHDQIRQRRLQFLSKRREEQSN